VTVRAASVCDLQRRASYRPDSGQPSIPGNVIRSTSALVRTLTSQREGIADFGQPLRNRLGFTGSPTIWLDGTDPFASPNAVPALACRVYASPDGLAGSPAVDRLVHALTLRAA
jgi:hypothetical protein